MKFLPHKSALVSRNLLGHLFYSQISKSLLLRRKNSAVEVKAIMLKVWAIAVQQCENAKNWVNGQPR